MFKTGPEVKVVGGLSPEEKKTQTEQESKKLRGFLYEAHLSNIDDYRLRILQANEFPKSPEQRRIIEMVNEATNNLRKLAGVEPYNIPERNFHIVPDDLYGEIEEESFGGETVNSSAMTIAGRQIMLFTSFARMHPIIFANEAFHETLHLKSPIILEEEKTNIQADSGEQKDILKKKCYRFGFEINSALKKDKTGKEHSHFSGLNEAFIALCEKHFTKQIIKEMAKKDEEMKWLGTNEAQELKEKIAAKGGFSADDIFWLFKDGEKWAHLSYPWQREVLEYIISELHKVLPEEYPNEQAALVEFIKSYFTSKISLLAHSIEKVFGKGSFEVLGMMTSEKLSAILTLEYFQRHRHRKTHKK